MTHLQLEPKQYCVAEIPDVPEVVELCARFHKESWQVFADFDYDKMTSWIVEKVRNEEDQIFLAKKHGEVIGVLIGMIFSFPYSNTLVGGDYIWYVVPQERGGIAGVRLMKMFEAWAKENGAVRIMTGATSGIASNRAARLMMRLGFEPMGSFMQKEI